MSISRVKVLIAHPRSYLILSLLESTFFSNMTPCSPKLRSRITEKVSLCFKKRRIETALDMGNFISNTSD